MIVLDVSAAAGLCQMPKNPEALDALFNDADKIIAPEFFRVEAAQVAWKYVHAGVNDKKHAKLLMECMINCVDEFVDDADLLVEALGEAVWLDHSVYDMLYFVLARRASAQLLTCDKRLSRLCKKHGVESVELIDL